MIVAIKPPDIRISFNLAPNIVLYMKVGGALVLVDVLMVPPSGRAHDYASRVMLRYGVKLMASSL